MRARSAWRPRADLTDLAPFWFSVHYMAPRFEGSALVVDASGSGGLTRLAHRAHPLPVRRVRSARQHDGWPQFHGDAPVAARRADAAVSLLDGRLSRRCCCARFSPSRPAPPGSPRRLCTPRPGTRRCRCRRRFAARAIRRRSGMRSPRRGRAPRRRRGRAGRVRRRGWLRSRRSAGRIQTGKRPAPSRPRNRSLFEPVPYALEYSVAHLPATDAEPVLQGLPEADSGARICTPAGPCPGRGWTHL